uniref:Uncharacterized protein n=1 Tax=Onchocerca volvulus TaxID=6282 RepID=A0A8R1XZS5_ONCVO
MQTVYSYRDADDVNKKRGNSYVPVYHQIRITISCPPSNNQAVSKKLPNVQDLLFLSVVASQQKKKKAHENHSVIPKVLKKNALFVGKIKKRNHHEATRWRSGEKKGSRKDFTLAMERLHVAQLLAKL